MPWPIDPARLAPFLVAALLVELTPGPNMGYLAMVAAAQGRRAGLLGVAGATFALGVYATVAAVGLAGPLIENPALYAAIRWMGVGYLFWLAFEAWRVGDPGAASSTPDQSSDQRIFLRSAAANLLNIKAALFYIVVAPEFVAPARAPITSQLLILGYIHVALSIAVHSAIVLGASSIAPGGFHAAGRTAPRAFAIGLMLIAIWLIFASRR